MRNPDRIDPMIEQLRSIWKAHPDWRLGQLIANGVRAETGQMNCDPFYIEDEDLLKGLKKGLKQF